MTSECNEASYVDIKSLIRKFESNKPVKENLPPQKNETPTSKVKQIQKKFQAVQEEKKINTATIIKTSYKPFFSEIKEMFEKNSSSKNHLKKEPVKIKKEETTMEEIEEKNNEPVKVKEEILIDNPVTHKEESKRERIRRQRRETNRNITLVSGHLNFILKDKKSDGVIKVSELKDKIVPSNEIENECSKLKYVNYDE